MDLPSVVSFVPFALLWDMAMSVAAVFAFTVFMSTAAVCVAVCASYIFATEETHSACHLCGVSTGIVRTCDFCGALSHFGCRVGCCHADRHIQAIMRVAQAVPLVVPTLITGG
jgi:hypothetical protein